MIYKNISIAFLSLALFACNGQAADQSAQENDTIQEATMVEESMEEQQTEGKYGADITPDGALSASEFLAAMEGKDSLAVKLRGNIEACCVKKGCWMDLDLENGTTMKVKFKDYGFFVPLDSKGKTTIIKGTAYLEETSVEDLKHYAEDGGKTQEEIDAITEPELAYNFVAEGVIIE